jgi:hypothetical protein
MNFPLSLRFSLLSVTALMCTACDPCENHILQEEPAPSGTQKAVVFQRQCGVLGGTSTQVSVLPASAQPFAGGNIFGADANADQSLEMPSGGPPIAVKWLGEQELQIAYDTRMRVFQSEKMLGDVTISYNAQTAQEPAPAASSLKRHKK